MATVFKLDNRPNWLMQIRLPDGSRPPYKSSRTGNKKKAKQMAQAWEVRARKEFESGNAKTGQAYLRIIVEAENLANDGKLSASKAEELIRKIYDYANPEAQAWTLRTYWDAYIKREQKTASPSAIANTKAAQKCWFKALGKQADRLLTMIQLDNLEDAYPEMVKGLTGKGLSPDTITLYRGEIIAVLDDAVARKVLDSNPAKQLKTARRVATKQSTPKGVFTPDELLSLLNAADDEWKGMILGGLYTGLRMMDVATLSTDDIEDGFIMATSGKTETNTDTPVHPRFMAWIGDRQGPLFPNQRNESNACISTRFAALMKKAKVEKLTTIRKRTFKRRFHELRHTFSSMCANADIPSDVRMALTGSSDPKVASRYVHVSDEKLIEAIAAIPDLQLDPEFEVKGGAA